jgi:hypothetical protein
LLLSTRWLAAQLQLDKLLPNGNSVLLVDQKFFDGTGFRGVYGDVNLVRLDSRYLFVLLNIVANLCRVLATTTVGEKAH